MPRIGLKTTAEELAAFVIQALWVAWLPTCTCMTIPLWTKRF